MSLLDALPESASEDFITLDEHWSAHNYAPLPVVITSGEGARVTGTDGRQYLDFLAGYSALNFGHRHPELIAAATEQLGRVTLTTRAVHHDQLGPFCRELAELTATEAVLPMNSGAEAVETAIKVARKWAYRIKGVPENAAQIVVAARNVHGRTTTVVSFSSDESARAGFGPFTPGFVTVPYGDSEALREAVTEHTAAVLLEPIQGEAGVIVPPPGYLRSVREACDAAGALFIADEVQSGFCRTGPVLALEHEGVRADLYTLGKALGGGIVPLSAVVGARAVLDVVRPGEHGSTFGGNPLACAVGRAVLRLVATGEFQRRSVDLVFVDGERITGVLDWSEAGRGDALFDLAIMTLGHAEQLGHVVAGYGTDVDLDVIRGWWAWRSLVAIRWLVGHGFDPFAPGCEVDVLRARM